MRSTISSNVRLGSMKHGITAGGGAVRECIAYVVDRGLARVPPTGLASIAHPSFHWNDSDDATGEIHSALKEGKHAHMIGLYRRVGNSVGAEFHQIFPLSSSILFSLDCGSWTNGSMTSPREGRKVGSLQVITRHFPRQANKQKRQTINLILSGSIVARCGPGICKVGVLR
jgi:hypothetical protein